MTRPYSTPLWEKKFRDFKTLGHREILRQWRLVVDHKVGPKKEPKTTTFPAFREVQG